jgi:hypothetical protein
MRPDEAAVACRAKFDADKQSIGVAKDRTHCHVVDVEETADLARIRCPVAQGKCAAASDHEQRSQSRQSRYLANPDMMSWLKPSATHSAACELARNGMTAIDARRPRRDRGRVSVTRPDGRSETLSLACVDGATAMPSLPRWPTIWMGDTGNFLDIAALRYVLLNSAPLPAAPPTAAHALEIVGINEATVKTRITRARSWRS